MKIANAMTEKVLHDHLHFCLLNACDEGVEQFYAGEEMGRGVRTTRDFNRTEFVVEYSGDLISTQQEHDQRHLKYDENKIPGSFFFSFKFKNRLHW